MLSPQGLSELLFGWLGGGELLPTMRINQANSTGGTAPTLQYDMQFPVGEAPVGGAAFQWVGLMSGKWIPSDLQLHQRLTLAAIPGL